MASTAECGREDKARSGGHWRCPGGDLGVPDGVVFAGSQHHDPGWVALSIRISVRGPNGEEEEAASSVLLALHGVDGARGGRRNSAGRGGGEEKTGDDAQAGGAVAHVDRGRAEAKRFLFLLHVDSVWRLTAMEASGNKFVSGICISGLERERESERERERARERERELY